MEKLLIYIPNNLDIFKQWSAKEENKMSKAEQGKKMVTEVWYRKWEVFSEIAKMLLKSMTGVAFLIGFLMIGISTWDAITEPEGANTTEIWEEPDALIWKSIVEADKEKGNAVYIGITISKEMAVEMAKDNAQHFNKRVAEQRADFEAGITAKIPTTFENAVDVYWCPKEKALFIVPRGMIVDAEYEKIHLDE